MSEHSMEDAMIDYLMELAAGDEEVFVYLLNELCVVMDGCCVSSEIFLSLYK